MDRDGRVIEHLDRALPDAFVLDVGAGNGFTAIRLSSTSRIVVALEPDPDMIDEGVPVLWAQGVAQRLPFRDDAFHGAYATWAFFFAGSRDDIDDGLEELNRVVRHGGTIVVVDNAGGDEFSSLWDKNIASDRSWWRPRGFQETLIETSFRFDSLDEARELLGFYFGDDAVQNIRGTEIQYDVVAYGKVLEKR